MKVKIDKILLMGNWNGDYKVTLILSIPEELALDLIGVDDGDYLEISVPETDNDR